MPYDPRLTIDFTREENDLTVLPRLPLINSDKLGWNGINVQYHRQPAWASSSIATGLYRGITKVQVTKGNRLHSGAFGRGNFFGSNRLSFE